MATLLTLPREIRNEIWKLCVVSRTGSIAPLSRNAAFYHHVPGSTSASGPHYYLMIANPDIDAYNECSSIESGSITLSLPRTNRQIHSETNHLFWSSHTFIFRDPHNLMCTFKGMGQLPSRCITSICISLGQIEGNVLQTFKKTSDLLAKGRSATSLQRLDLVLNTKQLTLLQKFKFWYGGAATHPRGPKALSGRWYDARVVGARIEDRL